MPTRKSVVDRAILFKNPARVPLWIDSDNINKSDVLTYELSMSQEDNPLVSEWGFRRVKEQNGQWLVPPEPTLPDWKDVDFYEVPPLDPSRRLAGINQAALICGDRYRMASFGLSGYSVYRALRGVELSNVDFLIETDRFVELFEFIFKFEVEIFDYLSRKGFHAIEYCDDWGPRKNSHVTLSLWKRLLRKHYVQSFKRAKESGLHIWFSTSADCEEFYGDLKDIGVDVIRIESPLKMELAKIGRQYRGKICFATRLDEIVTDSPDSEEMVRHIYDCLGCEFGGFIGTIAENVSDEKIDRIAEIVNKLR